MKAPDTKGVIWTLAKATALSLIVVGCLTAQRAAAQISGDPYSGYDASQSYMLDYVDGTSFTQGNTSDVEVDVTIAGETHAIDVDTGSRGLYMSTDELGANFNPDVPGTYSGQIDLTSSKRLLSGVWVPTQVSFSVEEKIVGSPTLTSTIVTSTVNLLDVTTLAAKGDKAFFGTTVDSGTIKLDGSGTVEIKKDPTSGKYGVILTDGQSISYANNLGLLKSASNMGIGFDLGGIAGGTGPVINNENQIYNPLLNLAQMQNGTLAAGYIVTSTGIQLGLTSADKGYAYTTLNTTGLTSDNSVPDWQTPLGQTMVSGTLNLPGSIVMDSGIANSYLSAPGLSGTITQLSVDLINSGGAVGYKIDLSDPENVLNPSEIDVVPSATGTMGTYTQSRPPFQGQYFNTGRNVFDDFNMLYDADNGYMGLLPNDHGETDPNIYFTAEAGGFPNPLAVPESKSTAVVLLGLLLFVLRSVKRSRERRLLICP